jgi:hypothetical protein
VNATGRDSNRSRSGLRSRLQLDASERLMMEELAKGEFEAQVEELRNQDGVTDEDVENFKKAAIIQKSIDLVKQRSYE